MVPQIGLILKILHDQLPQLRIIATGSSSFDLNNELGEPLTGRKQTFYLYPIAQLELNARENPVESYELLPERMIFGTYPEVLQYETYQDKSDYLRELIGSYLLKDILVLDKIHNPDKLWDILKLIALQIGQEVSLHEIGQKVNMGKNTVARYLDLLKKGFVLFEVKAFSRNPRTEISKRSHYYFYDNGVRNAVLDHFRLLENRQDTGQLWENYIIAERIKKRAYHRIRGSFYFWRTYSQQEIDWIEESQGELTGYELKYKKQKAKKPPKWQTFYPHADFQVIHKENYMDFIT